MALQNDTTSEYARILVKDTAEFNLDNKVFVVQTYKDESTRNNPGQYDKPIYHQHNFSANWNLSITGTSSLNDISDEAYRCLKLETKYSSGWSDV